MSGDDGIYAPKSPDLSSFYSAGPTPPAEQPAPTQQNWPLSHPQQPRSQFSPQQQQPQAHLQQGSASTYFSGPPEGDARSSSSFPVQHHKPQLSTPPQTLAQARPPISKENQPPPITTFGGVGYSPQQSQLYSPYLSHPQPGLPGQPQSVPGYTAPSPQSSLSYQHQTWYTPNNSSIGNSFQQWRPFDQIPTQYQHQQQQPYQPQPQQQQQQQQQLHDPHSLTAYNAQYQAHLVGQLGASLLSQDNNSTSAMPPKRSAASRAEPPPPTIEPSPVKTKFPTARIKRIMQADEEVGKVAQQTPIAVGKALEMFMVALVTKSADVAREKNSKRVSAQMLKQVVESDDQWDFLREIVSRVENAEEKKGGPSKSKSVAESESEEEAPPVEKKKRAVRKKKV